MMVNSSGTRITEELVKKVSRKIHRYSILDILMGLMERSPWFADDECCISCVSELTGRQCATAPAQYIYNKSTVSLIFHCASDPFSFPYFRKNDNGFAELFRDDKWFILGKTTDPEK